MYFSDQNIEVLVKCCISKRFHSSQHNQFTYGQVMRNQDKTHKYKYCIRAKLMAYMIKIECLHSASYLDAGGDS